VVPYLHHRLNDRGWQEDETRFAHFLPDQINIEGETTTDIRYRGIFEIPVYTANLEVTGSFPRPHFSEWQIEPEDILWQRAALAFGISDARAIRDPVVLQFGGERHSFEPGTGDALFCSSGIHAPVTNLQDGSSDETYPFSFSLRLNGAGRMMFQPAGMETAVRMVSDWPHPSFGGAYLPEEREVGENGFTASWRVLHFGRNYPQKWRHSTVGPEILQQSEFGVDFSSPVDAYRMTRRSVKYELMFTFLTFAAFLLFEILHKVKIHPIPYLLVGSALCLFYLLTLSLSEHMGFGFSYLLAAAGVAGSVSAYCVKIVGRKAQVLAVSLVVLYGFLYLLLSLENYSLLIGSVGLFLILTVVMFLTRNIDWYRFAVGTVNGHSGAQKERG
jgi:inner membrane protein